MPQHPSHFSYVAHDRLASSPAPWRMNTTLSRIPGESIMSQPAIAIVGGGPTGLMLAAELTIAGIQPLVLERRADQTVSGSRAGGLHARTLEILDQRGVAERFLSLGQPAQVAGFAWNRLDISDFPTRFPYGLGLWQSHIERILAEWVGELGVEIRYGSTVSGLSPSPDGVSITLSDGTIIQTDYVVGCDGGRSFVRKAAGIAFPGWDATTSNLLAEAELAERPELGTRTDATGMHSLGRVNYTIEDGKVVYADHGPVRIMLTEADSSPRRDPTLDDLRAAMIAVYGTDYGVHSPVSISRFTDMARQAETYRQGRVLLAGDAAHIHSPIGGQGLNIGVQDAVNLGWKLALVAKGLAPDSLLDTYHTERHPIGARLLETTMAQSALVNRHDPSTLALRRSVARLLAMDEPRRVFGAMQSGLDVQYDPGEGHPLLGRRMPDLDLADGPVARVYALLHEARFVLLDLGLPGRPDLASWHSRLVTVSASTPGPWLLPDIGAVEAPRAVLIRPDGHVAWVGVTDWSGLTGALSAWSGPPD